MCQPKVIYPALLTVRFAAGFLTSEKQVSLMPVRLLAGVTTTVLLSMKGVAFAFVVQLWFNSTAIKVRPGLQCMLSMRAV